MKDLMDTNLKLHEAHQKTILAVKEYAEEIEKQLTVTKSLLAVALVWIMFLTWKVL